MSKTRFYEEDEDEDIPGDVSNFQQPTGEEWMYANEDNLYPECAGLDLSADLILDGETQYAAIFFTKIGETLRNKPENVGASIITTLRETLREVNNQMMDGVMKPDSDQSILTSLRFLFDQLLKKALKG